jgi:hypothetical protein
MVQKNILSFQNASYKVAIGPAPQAVMKRIR